VLDENPRVVSAATPIRLAVVRVVSQPEDLLGGLLLAWTWLQKLKV
jgi:hypothetical protein